jgi:hypothetical protein
MHRTLKAETTRPPAVDLIRQQRAFAAFRREYNEVRPHAALGGDPPAARYVASPRAYPATLPPLEYPGHFLVKRVTHAGTIRFTHKLLFLANALQEHLVGLEESDDGIWSLYLGPVLQDRRGDDEGLRLNRTLTKCHPSSRNKLSPIIPLAQGRAMSKILKRLVMLVRKRPVMARLPDIHIVR